MDYTGRDFRNLRYLVNRPLTEDEWATRYTQKEAKAVPPMDFLSVIKMNSTYIDLVDRWYPIMGFSVWLGFFISLIGFLFPFLLLGAISNSTNGFDVANTIGSIIFIPLFIAIGCAGLFMIRTESWRWTHYPMRLNRKMRQVHVFRQNGTILTVPWDELFIARGQARSPLAGTTYDLRAHILDIDGVTVKESFTLGYPSLLGDAQSIDKFWAFLQSYMESPDGVERTYSHLKKTGYLVAVDGRKEGWRWSIARSFMLAAHWPWLQLLGAPFLAMNAVGRMFAMWTSKQPHWPEEIERCNEVAPSDPYILTWRNNAPLGWWELGWPLICTVLGVVTFLGAIVWLLSITF